VFPRSLGPSHWHSFWQALSGWPLLPRAAPTPAPEPARHQSLPGSGPADHAPPSYSELLQIIRDGKVKELDLSPHTNGRWRVVLNDGTRTGMCRCSPTIQLLLQTPSKGPGFPCSQR